MQYQGPIQINTGIYWLLTGVKDGIDLNRMSTADNRDFQQGISGSHMAGDSKTPFIEVPFDEPPDNTYLLHFEANLTVADFRGDNDPSFESKFYGKSQKYSQQVFIQNSGEYKQNGINSILRHSAPLKAQGIEADVFGLFPEALANLSLKSIEPIGDNSPPISITLFGGKEIKSTLDYAKPLTEHGIGGNE